MKRAVFIVLGVVVLAVAALFAYRQVRANASPAAARVATTQVRVGDVSQTVSAAGNIAAVNSADLDFAGDGLVTKVNVQKGDHIHQGEVLAAQDAADLDLQVQAAQIDLQQAQAKLADLKAGPTQADQVSAQASLASAQANLSRLTSGANAASVSSAQAALATAQINLKTVKAGPDAATIQADQAALVQAQNSLTASYSNRDATCGKPDANACEQARAGVANAELAVQKAQEQLTRDQAGPTADDVRVAELAVTQARAQLRDAYSQTSAADLEAARKGVEQAQANLDALAPTSVAIQLAQADVDNAQSKLDSLQLQRTDLQITAPFDGVVTAINMYAGERSGSTSSTSSSTSPAIQLVDLDHLEIVVNLAEVDVAQVAVGQPVAITLDALPALNLTGTVTEVAAVGTQTSGVVQYPVTVAIDKAGSEVKPGMTANLAITVAQHTGVLLVPSRAVQTRNGQSTVIVLSGGQQVQTQVTTGLTGDTGTEIVSGLTAGDTVVLPTGTTGTATGGAGGNFRGGFGPGGPGGFGP